MTTFAPLAPSAPLPRRVLVFLVVLYAVCVIACALTRDFGFYSDDKLHAETVRVTYESGVLLPRYYHYPSLGYVISLLASLPSFAAQGFDAQALAAELAEALRCGLLPPPRLVLDGRLAFAAVSDLALFWVALLAWRLSSSRLAACAAALVLASSFEFHYHARQWAPDAPMAQFACLSVMLAHQYATTRAKRHFFGAAVAAGLAAGTKFPGALALSALGVAILAVEVSGDGSRLAAFARSARAGFLALLVLFAT
ncbi:MAG TPA: glycosyltransferase family 39 protein, partial [Planctomycetota bacterium]|nr:glycosyltransferase family 39 protein [Planctomycetota bacterium]